jgi:hypothetical protein
MGSSDLHTPANIITVIRRRRMKQAGHVARMGQNTNVHRILLGKLKRKRQLESYGHWIDMGKGGCGMEFI